MIHYYYYAFVCLLSCILLYLCDSDIYMIVICAMCALYFEFLYMSYHLFYAHVPCFCVYTLMQMFIIYIWSFICVIHYYYYAFMCLPSCIKLYLCDSDIYLIVIYDMCALYFEFFIWHITCVMLTCLCFRVLLRSK